MPGIVHRSLRACALLAGFGSFISPAFADFASSVTGFSEGSFATVSGTHYNNLAGAVGKPSPIVGNGTAFPGVLSPYEAHYQTPELTAFGRGGSITLQFPQALPVSGTPQIGIFTKLSLVDPAFDPTPTTADTDQMDEFGAERTAIVEVASNPNDFRSLGRVVFDDPTNYFANATNPYQFPAPDPAQLADFNKPFAGKPSDFDGADFAGVLAKLNGSAGGTWVSIPVNLGLSSVQYLRLSDPMWQLPDNSLVSDRPSKYFPAPNEFIKPADLFVDGAVLILEPGMVGLIVFASLMLRRKR